MVWHCHKNKKKIKKSGFAGHGGTHLKSQYLRGGVAQGISEFETSLFFIVSSRQPELFRETSLKGEGMKGDRRKEERTPFLSQGDISSNAQNS